MLKSKVLKILTAIAVAATITTAQTGAVIYTNNINSEQDLNGWELYDVSFSDDNGGQIVFGGDGVAVMPELPADANKTNMAVGIRAVWPDWIYLHTSPDGVNYTDQGVFNSPGGGDVVNSNKRIPDGTRFLRFKARNGTNGDVFLVAVTVRGGIPSATTTTTTTVATAANNLSAEPTQATQAVSSNAAVENETAPSNLTVETTRRETAAAPKTKRSFGDKLKDILAQLAWLALWAGGAVFCGLRIPKAWREGIGYDKAREEAQQTLNDFEAEWGRTVLAFNQQKAALRGIYEDLTGDSRAFLTDEQCDPNNE